MNTATTARVATVVVLGTLALALPATSAYAGPVSNGCPPSYTLIGTTQLGPDYLMPGRMDTQFGSYGQAPNGNGLVCALPLGNATTASGGQLYNFMDDSLPAG